MERHFNTAGACNPQQHYMVNIQKRLEEIRKMVDQGQYFVISRARQYGKTTTLFALADYLKKDYIPVLLDFQTLSDADYADEKAFVNAFASIFMESIYSDGADKQFVREDSLFNLDHAAEHAALPGLRVLFQHLRNICRDARKPVVLIIDEVDSASNHQIFLDFLAQLRAYYLARGMQKNSTFWSVILAGLYDIRNLQLKIRPESEHRQLSPWNIAASFDVDMSLPADGIEDMLTEYEKDHEAGMDVHQMSRLLSDYTSGYPFLVSRLCQIMDENMAGTSEASADTASWTKEGFLKAVRVLLNESNSLFESMINKLQDYPELREVIYRILFCGQTCPYNPDARWTGIALMFGFIRRSGAEIEIANRIFEIRLYNYFLLPDETKHSPIYLAGAENKPQFIRDGVLDMKLILQKYVEHFDSIYGDNREKFDEAEGCRRFLLYLRPIINGTGNYYIEARTRNSRRMDVVVDYHAAQYVIELKVWRGNAYHERGEKQLSEYLDYFHLKKGYMLSYNFNQKKKIGVQEIALGERILVEAVV